jgi:hypothetical protein
MSIDLLKILADSNKDIDNQKLMDYVSGHLTGQELHEVEKTMAENAFVNDAIEGLQAVTQKSDINALVDQLNSDLRRNLQKKKARKEKLKFKDQPWIYLAIALILLLIFAASVVLYRLYGSR